MCTSAIDVLQKVSCETNNMPEDEVLMLSLYNRSWVQSWPFQRGEVRHPTYEYSIGSYFAALVTTTVDSSR